jgi:hypothetical protein
MLSEPGCSCETSIGWYNFMKYIVFAVAFAGLLGSAAQARRSSSEEMMMLTPETRLEQRCNARAMGEIERQHKGFKPDEFVAYAFGDTAIRGDKINAPGGAIRSHGNWYRVSYACQTSPDGLQVKSFTYQLGAIVPRQDWDKHFLVP